MTDDEIRDILKSTRVIAMVGYSANPARPSHGVARYMRAQGYRVIPVNPGLAGQEIEGELVYPDLASIPETEGVDMVDIFRAPEAVPGIVDEALAHLPGAATIWMQIGVVNEPAAQAARAAGKKVVMDRCPKIEHARLLP
ncbi:CoA-binding protein [Sinirhodobacter populi]|uniref:CoA-binding protein n=1 Tax=Paenirhodobacter populi TaxID=2306993 RepID=A0A443K9F9_9RHOB|nr:CoA-binding protein [Sinirhodobacter populi]RWR29431.1 CoA-binding protein [Sinirhodobacter populi]